MCLGHVRTLGTSRPWVSGLELGYRNRTLGIGDGAWVSRSDLGYRGWSLGIVIGPWVSGLELGYRDRTLGIRFGAWARQNTQGTEQKVKYKIQEYKSFYLKIPSEITPFKSFIDN